MKTTITGKLSEVVIQKDHIEKKVAKFDKFFQDDATAKVKIGKVSNQETVELTIYSQGTIYRSEQSDTTAMNALDKCIYVIERQIRKNKTKLEKRLRQDVFVKGAGNDSIDEVIDTEDADETYLVRTKSFKLKPMSVDEAIMQMNLLDHNFFVYVNDASGQVNVVYKRKDGNYGNITPDT